MNQSVDCKFCLLLTPWVYGNNLSMHPNKLENKSVCNFFRLTMTVLALLEDIANGFEGNGCSVTIIIFWLMMMMTGLSADSDFLELSSWNSVLSWAWVWRERRRGVTHYQFQYNPDYAWFSGNGIIIEGMTGQ